MVPLQLDIWILVTYMDGTITIRYLDTYMSHTWMVPLQLYI
jgi:hypothetical protein